ncbi:hypothetical protein EIP86_005386 [Pleurotus ostreatoroseus]|nr:hypothetical protein EIP86_005386 [Pleurotus ostreatoroseus]
MAGKSNKYIEFLDKSLPDFKAKPPSFVEPKQNQDDPPKPKSVYLAVPSERNDTTSQWRINTLKFTYLARNQFDLDEFCDAFKRATTRLSQTWTPPSLYDELCCRFSRMEDDTVGGVNDMKKLFSSDPSEVDGKKINSKNDYLPWGKTWAAFKWDSIEDVQKTCKALLPIEVKNFGALNESIFTWLAMNSCKLGQSDDRTLGEALDNDWLSLDGESQSARSASQQEKDAALRAIKGIISMI